MHRPTILIAGGHVTPSIALIEKLQEMGSFDIAYVGRMFAMEGDSVPSYEYRELTRRGIKFIPIIAGRLQRSFTAYTFVSLAKIPVGFWQALQIIHRVKPSLVVSFGGYVALPLALTASFFRIPIIAHEQTSLPGLANKIIGRFAQTVCISWPQTAAYFPQKKIVLTGNPLRKEFLSRTMKPVVVSGGKPLLYISGGSLGSYAINRAIADILPQLLEQFVIVHQCGDSALTEDYAFLQDKKSSLPRPLAHRYTLRSHLDVKEVVWLLLHAFLVVSRSGANTVTELAWSGSPSLLIPLPHAGNHEQDANALQLVKAGTAQILPQSDLTGLQLFNSIDGMVKKIGEYERKKKQAQALVHKDAAERLAGVVSASIFATTRK